MPGQVSTLLGSKTLLSQPASELVQNQLNSTPAILTSAINVDLPPFVPISTPNFCWRDVDGETFTRSINRCYEMIVHWRGNLFKVPSGRTGKAFVQELVRMFRAYADASSLESVAIKVMMVMLALLLQKPYPRSKAKDHILHLERRLRLWSERNLEGLMKEEHTTQHQFSPQHHNQSRSTQQTAHMFTKQMKGRMRAALQLIAEDINDGPLKLARLDQKRFVRSF